MRLKFRDAGEYNQTPIVMIRRNVRIPDTVMGDLHAQLAACSVGARRISDRVCPRPSCRAGFPPTPSGEMPAVMFGGLRASGSPFVIGELIAGGSGAGLECNGVLPSI